MTEGLQLQLDAARGWRMILRRFAALFAGEWAARVFGFVIVLLLARRLGPTGFGVITFGFTLVAWFSYVTDSGTELLNVREIARRPERFRPIAERVLGLRLALSAVATALFVASILLFARSELTRSTLVLFALLLPASALNLRWMVLGVGGSRAIALGQIVSRIVVLAGIVLLVADVLDIKRVPVIEAVGALVYGLVILVLVSRGGRMLRPRVDLDAWGTTLRQSLPLMGTGLARAVAVSFDIILIDLVLGPRDVGIYGVASKPTLFFTGAVGLFAMAFLSAFSATSGDAATTLQRKAIRWSFAVGLVVAACVSVGSLLIPFVFGAAYEDAVPVLAVIAWRIPLAVLSSNYASVLIARDRQAELMRNAVVIAVFVIAADTVAVLAFGLLGAAVVSIAAGALAYLLNRRSVRRDAAGPEATGLELPGGAVEQ